MRSPDQEESDHRFVINVVVTKDLRATAHAVVRRMPASTPEERIRKQQARMFVVAKNRRPSDLVAFIKRVEGRDVDSFTGKDLEE